MPDQDRPPGGVDPCDLGDERRPLGFLVREDDVGEVGADRRPVGRDDDRDEAVERLELLGRGARGGGHAGEARVEAQEVLQRHLPQDSALRGEPQALLGLDRRVEPVGPVAFVGDAAGRLVDQLDTPAPHDVVHVPPQEVRGVQRVAQLGVERDVLGRVEGGAAQRRLDPRGARLGEGDVVRVRVGVEVAAGDEVPHEESEPLRASERLPGLARDHERDAGLVDQDGIGLVHEGEVELALDPLRGLESEPVAQVVEARLLRREVRDVRGVGPLPLGDTHPLLHEADREPQALVHRTHPGGVAAGQVVVEGQNVRPAALQGVEKDGRHRGERLALAGRHLDDPAPRESDAGENLLVEGALPEGAPRGLPGQGEGLRELRLDLRPPGHPGAQSAGLLGEADVQERRDGRLEGGDGGETLPVGRQVLLDRPAAEAIEKAGEEQRLSVPPGSARRRGHGLPSL